MIFSQILFLLIPSHLSLLLFCMQKFDVKVLQWPGASIWHVAIHSGHAGNITIFFDIFIEAVGTLAFVQKLRTAPNGSSH